MGADGRTNNRRNKKILLRCTKLLEGQQFYVRPTYVRRKKIWRAYIELNITNTSCSVHVETKCCSCAWRGQLVPTLRRGSRPLLACALRSLTMQKLNPSREVFG